MGVWLALRGGQEDGGIQDNTHIAHGIEMGGKSQNDAFWAFYTRNTPVALVNYGSIAIKIGVDGQPPCEPRFCRVKQWTLKRVDCTLEGSTISVARALSHYLEV